MKSKMSYFLLISSCTFLMTSGLEAAEKSQAKSVTPADAKQRADNTDAKFDIMRRDEQSDTDALAIPFDDSEVEDEEQINRDEKQKVFNLPQRAK